MLSRILLASILLMTIGLAGCADSGPGPAASEAPEDSGTTASEGSNKTVVENNDTTPAPVENSTNAAPVASLVASAINGTSPLNVTFTLDGTDADGDNLTWTFSVNGTEIEFGTALPASINHVFMAGNHTATMTVSDGELEHAALAEVVVAAIPAPVVEKVVFTGEIVGVGLGCADPGDPETLVFQGDHDFDISPDLWTMAYDLQPASARVSWWLGEGLSDPIAAGGNAGNVPEQTTSGHVCFDDTGGLLSVGAPASWTLTIYKVA